MKKLTLKLALASALFLPMIAMADVKLADETKASLAAYEVANAVVISYENAIDATRGENAKLIMDLRAEVQKQKDAFVKALLERNKELQVGEEDLKKAADKKFEKAFEEINNLALRNREAFKMPFQWVDSADFTRAIVQDIKEGTLNAMLEEKVMAEAARKTMQDRVGLYTNFFNNATKQNIKGQIANLRAQFDKQGLLAAPKPVVKKPAPRYYREDDEEEAVGLPVEQPSGF